MDEPLKLSPSGGSGIKMTMILECEKSFYWRHVERWIQARMGKALAFGILLHQAFQYKDFRPFETQWTKGCIEAEDEGSDAKDIDRDEKDMTKDLRIARGMFDRLMEEDLKVLKTESYLQATPVDPATGDTPPEMKNVTICGTRDMIEDFEGREILSDLKTARTGWKPSDVLGSAQLQTYRYAEACAGETIHDTGSFLVITKHEGGPDLKRHMVQMNDDDHFSVFETIRASVQAIERCYKTQEYRKNVSNCVGAYGSLCAYHPMCFPHRYEDPEAVINEKLICIGERG